MKKISLLLAASVMFCSAIAQDDLLNELESKAPRTAYAESTFKGSRLVNGQTVETRGRGELEFIFSHRFGAMNSGSYNLYGLDQAAVRLGLEYGITDRWGIGFGRSSSDSKQLASKQAAKTRCVVFPSTVLEVRWLPRC
jgi:hypothetical protein